MTLALCHQVRTVSAGRLSSGKGRVDDDKLRSDVEQAVRLWLAITA